MQNEQITNAAFQLGDIVRKKSGSQWQGRVVGHYSTALTPEGYAVESDTEKGSVQIYPAKALEVAQPSRECLQQSADVRDPAVEKPEAGRYVLAWMEGKAIPIRAMWVPSKWLQADDECPEDWAEYDEAKDEYFCPEGWYEKNEHEEKNWSVSTPVVAWMELPRLDAALQAAPPAPAAVAVLDTERLDWLEQHEDGYYNLDRVASIVGTGFLTGPLNPILQKAHATLREAIDSARGASATAQEQARDADLEAVRKVLCKLPKYSFLIDTRGNLRRSEDASGNWVEFDAVHKLFDPVAVDAARAAQGGTQ